MSILTMYIQFPLDSYDHSSRQKQRRGVGFIEKKPRKLPRPSKSISRVILFKTFFLMQYIYR
jgi:hypothetical protein